LWICFGGDLLVSDPSTIGRKLSTMKKVKVMKKTPMKKAMKVSVIAKGKRAKSSVWQGKKEKTSTGLKKDMLFLKYFFLVVPACLDDF